MMGFAEPVLGLAEGKTQGLKPSYNAASKRPPIALPFAA
jgi:hypothetical protein